MLFCLVFVVGGVSIHMKISTIIILLILLKFSIVKSIVEKG